MPFTLRRKAPWSSPGTGSRSPSCWHYAMQRTWTVSCSPIHPGFNDPCTSPGPPFVSAKRSRTCPLKKTPTYSTHASLHHLRCQPPNTPANIVFIETTSAPNLFDPLCILRCEFCGDSHRTSPQGSLMPINEPLHRAPFNRPRRINLKAELLAHPQSQPLIPVRVKLPFED